MYLLIVTIEIALLIILPLIIFFKRSEWNYRSYIFIIPVLYLIWYLSYALLHELSHMLGVWISGKEIYNYQLIPHFWEGEFGKGFVNYNYQGDKKDFLIIILPYIRDIIFLLIGYRILKKRKIKQSFWLGLILIMLIFSPLFDISNNYIAFLMGSMNDFNSLRDSGSSLVSNSIGISFIAFAVFISIKCVILGKGYPKPFETI
jgi:hypothetical protein